jgi:hypothetical protein
VTCLFEGGIMHRDSLGTEQPIAPGEVNWRIAAAKQGWARDRMGLVVPGDEREWIPLPERQAVRARTAES